MGKVKIAQHLARSGLHLAATTVGRFLKTEESQGPADAARGAEEEEPEPKPERAVTSKRPNHVAHVDMTVVPTFLGGFWSSVTGTLPTVFPFCYWLVVLQDHFSRRIQAFEVFRREPASATIQAFLDRAFEAIGVVPKHVILDRGRQFDCEAFRRWCRRYGLKWRYGAAGKKGSIAVIERLIRTIKTECTRAIRVPFSAEAMRAELDAYVRWHNQHRPHTHLRGRTADEVYFGRRPANEVPRLEPRLKYPRDAGARRRRRR
jgi:transposase InsO family protein